MALILRQFLAARLLQGSALEQPSAHFFSSFVASLRFLLSQEAVALVLLLISEEIGERQSDQL